MTSDATWISILRPSRRPLRGLLRMTFFLNAIKELRHPEERPEGASRRTHNGFAACLSQLARDLRKGSAEAGTHLSKALAFSRWIPACAGTTQVPQPLPRIDFRGGCRYMHRNMTDARNELRLTISAS